MDFRKINIKVYLGKGDELPLRQLIPVFHRYIQKNLLEGMLIDVAEYTHVHHGPGVLLIAHEGNYSLDETDGKRGMLYNQKRSESIGGKENLKNSLRRALMACDLLEKEPDLKAGLKFNPSRMRIFVNDRLGKIGDNRGFSELEEIIRPLLASLTDSPVKLVPEMDSRKLVSFEVEIEKILSVTELLARI